MRMSSMVGLVFCTPPRLSKFLWSHCRRALPLEYLVEVGGSVWAAAGRRIYLQILSAIRLLDLMHVFTYGSLMFPEIWQRVVRGNYLSATATLADHARYALADDTYPGMVPQPQASVEGVLYYNVDEQDIAALDVFEGSEYRRQNVNVVIESGDLMIACTYIFLAGQRLSGIPWEPQAFQMSRFIGTYCSDKMGG
jgi:gamma-glutamylcyclotransferase (GGCT)/AIG2-like uncharacterized protein YtfP